MSVADALNQADHAEDGEMTWEAAKVLAAEVRRLSANPKLRHDAQ